MTFAPSYHKRSWGHEHLCVLQTHSPSGSQTTVPLCYAPPSPIGVETDGLLRWGFPATRTSGPGQEASRRHLSLKTLIVSNEKFPTELTAVPLSRVQKLFQNVCLALAEYLPVSISRQRFSSWCLQTRSLVGLKTEWNSQTNCADEMSCYLTFSQAVYTAVTEL